MYKHPRNVSKNVQNYISSGSGDIPIVAICQQASKPTNIMTDMQYIQNYLEQLYKHPRNVSKNFQKDISCGTKDIKQFSQLMTD